MPDPILLAALDRLCLKHPALIELRRLLAPDLNFTPEFHAAYLRSTISYGIRALLIRLLTGDVVLDGALQCTADSMRRVMTWLRLEGVFTGDVDRERIPKGFSTIVGIDRYSVSDFVTHAFIAPWWRARSGLDTTIAAYADIDPRDLVEVLAPAVRARMLSRTAAERWIADDDEKRSLRLSRWYFQTGVAAIDLTNTMTFLAALLDGDRKGGRIQNRLPIPLTERWGLSRLSLPEATAFADVTTLAIDGLLDLPAADPVRLRDVFDDPAAVAWVKEHASVALVALRQRTRITLDRAVEIRDQGMGGVFDTGLLFNIERLTGRAGEMQRPPLARFRTYYDGLDLHRVINSHRNDWVACGVRDPGFLMKLGLTGGRARDLGNIAAFLLANRATDHASAWSVLPAPARYALGVPEPKPTTRSAVATARRPTGRVDVKTGHLPLLEETLLSATRVGRTYLLTPSYRGPRPAEGSVYVHRAHAEGWQLPFDAEIVGEVPLPWGVDPIEDAERLLRQQADAVVRL